MLQLEEEAFRACVQAVEKSVVQIRTVGGLAEVDGRLVAEGPTTGLVISADGYILSSEFNFEQLPASILVTLADGRQLPAEWLATDHSRKIVLLKASGTEDLPVPAFVPASEVEVGAWAIALGRTFGVDRCNVSVGIVSARDRIFGKALQTDAAISPANYGGPLIDIRGRVYGLIVPLAPTSMGGTTGTQWYDSGIGFAVPLDALSAPIERMKAGEDQFEGLLGVAMARGNPFADLPMIATVRPRSPADAAGLQAGDQIVAVDNATTATTTDFRFQLAPRYAGDEITLAVERDGERITEKITLAKPFGAFRHAFLGILPRREVESSDAASEEAPASPGGVVVRMVYPQSPAAQAGLEPGDRITEINHVVVNELADAFAAMNHVAVNAKAEITFERDGDQQSRELVAHALPTNIPDELPPAYLPQSGSQGPPQERVTGIIDLAIPGSSHECQIYVPSSYQNGLRPAVMLALPSADEAGATALLESWQPHCEEHDILMIVADLSEESLSSRARLQMVRGLVGNVMKDYDVDANRVVAFGEGDAGELAFLCGLAHRQVFRGVAVINSPVPRRLRVPDANAESRLAFFVMVPEERSLTVNFGLRKIQEAGYPVTSIRKQDDQPESVEETRGTLARWIDTLDRF